jgi:hypothetical protein
MASAVAEMVIVVRSGPATAGARRALDLCAARAARGEPTTLVLLGDAVRVAREADAAGATVLCLEEDAAMRGLAFDGLAQVRAAGYPELVDVLMSGARVIGAL